MLALCLVAASIWFGASEAATPSREVKAAEDLPPAATGYPDTAKWRYLRARQWLSLGEFGQLLPPSEYAAPAEDAVIVVPDGERLHLFLAVRFDEGEPIATVESNGRVTFAPSINSQLEGYKYFKRAPQLSQFPQQWPLDIVSGKPVFPASAQVLARAGSISNKTRKVPSGSVGWVVSSIIDGNIIFPVESGVPPEDVLWVIPEVIAEGTSRGFSLVHSGPSKTGEYLRVNSSGKISFTGEEKDHERGDADEYWPFYDTKTKALTTNVCGWSLNFRGYAQGTKLSYDNCMPVSAALPPIFEKEH